MHTRRAPQWIGRGDDLLLTTKDENDETNPYQNCVGEMTLPPYTEESPLTA